VSSRILLVGASGFLGSHVAARLAHRDDVLALVRPTRDRRHLPPGLAVHQGDLDAPHSLPLDGLDALVYCASMALPGLPSLVSGLEQAGVRRAVFVSTTALFTSLPAPSRARRQAAERCVTESRLDWTILRPTMIYGTARDRNISRLLRALRRWPLFPLCGDALWQPIYVEDLADAVIAALDTPGTSHQTYNLAGAAPLRFSALIRTAAEAVGRSVILVPLPLDVAVLGAWLTHLVTPEQIRRLAEDKAFSYAEAARDFGFAPRSFADGVRREAAALGLAPRRP
jgi:nucleoside-diphosphate-sugar epimerase